ncbi:MAG: hypothetical protein DID92_2727743885 [Candidatus Nitrotoga sp. SPKER]|nr:MAG: hypothetical protein DID92_2727743885 [Candidatus Nitrotoga sp. SPKER]
MKKSIISLAIASCFVFGASLAQAQAISAPMPAMTQDKAEPFTGKGLNTPWNCCKQYVGFDGPRDQPGEVNKPGAKNNNSRNRDGTIDPGYKNDDGNRMSEFRRIDATSANNEHTDSKAYGAGKDAATTGRPEGSGDTLGQSHFTANSGYKQWVSK